MADPMGQATTSFVNGEYGNGIAQTTQGVGIAIPDQAIGQQVADYGAVTGNAVNFGVNNQDALGGVMEGLGGIAAVATGNNANVGAAANTATNAMNGAATNAVANTVANGAVAAATNGAANAAMNGVQNVDASAAYQEANQALQTGNAVVV